MRLIKRSRFMVIIGALLMKRFELFSSCHAGYVKDRAKLIGYACLIIFMCKRYSLLHIVILRYWVVPAIEHKQILFFFDRTSNPIGYVTWAHLAPDSELRLVKDPGFLLHPSEWNEGGKTWIIDFCFPAGGAREAVSQLKDFFRNEGVHQLFWARRDQDHAVRKLVSCLI
ncbi:MAG: hypothetical protein C0410_15675 [Anaerolinea sp.]|nr:hypothetical protein [Anaerolinea sp.]